MNLPAPVMAALIAALAALIGVAINFLSSLVTIWYAQDAKVRDWLFEKRLSDSEALVSALSTLITELEGMTAEISRIYVMTFGTVLDARGVVEGRDLGFLTEEFVLNKQRRLYERALDVDNESPEIQRRLNSFLEFELTRLTIWFDESDQSKEWVSVLYRRYSSLISEQLETVIEVKQWARDKKIVFEESFINEAEAISQVTDEAGTKLTKESAVILAEAVRIQKAIASRYINNSVPLYTFIKESFFKFR